MRSYRKSSLRRWCAALCGLLLSALLAPALVAGEAPGDVPWETIEAWALGDSPDVPGVKPADPKPTDPKTPVDPKAPQPSPDQPKAKPEPPPPGPVAVVPPTTPHTGPHKSEPRECREITEKYVQKVVPLQNKAEKDRDWTAAMDYAFRSENFAKAREYLLMMWSVKKYEAQVKSNWYNQRMWELGVLSLPQPSRQDLENCYTTWKTRQVQWIDDPANQPADENQAKQFKHREHANVDKRDDYFHSYPRVRTELQRLEDAGEDDPKYLWELCIRFGEDRPQWPLRYARVLYKLREWYPDFDMVKNGEVQSRLTKVLADWLWAGLFKEAADESATLFEKYPKQGVVTCGDALWIWAENRMRQGYDVKDNKKSAELLKEARLKFEQFQTKYPSHSNNIPSPQSHKSRTQDCLEQVTREIKKRD